MPRRGHWLFRTSSGSHYALLLGDLFLTTPPQGQKHLEVHAFPLGHPGSDPVLIKGRKNWNKEEAGEAGGWSSQSAVDSPGLTSSTLIYSFNKDPLRLSMHGAPTWNLKIHGETRHTVPPFRESAAHNTQLRGGPPGSAPAPLLPQHSLPSPMGSVPTAMTPHLSLLAHLPFIPGRGAFCLKIGPVSYLPLCPVPNMGSGI